MAVGVASPGPVRGLERVLPVALVQRDELAVFVEGGAPVDVAHALVVDEGPQLPVVALPGVAALLVGVPGGAGLGRGLLELPEIGPLRGRRTGRAPTPGRPRPLGRSPPPGRSTPHRRAPRHPSDPDVRACGRCRPACRHRPVTPRSWWPGTPAPTASPTPARRWPPPPSWRRAPARSRPAASSRRTARPPRPPGPRSGTPARTRPPRPASRLERSPTPCRPS